MTPCLRKKTYAFGGDSVLDEASKLFLVSILILLLQERHVFRHVQTQNVFAVDLCVKFFAFSVIARETLGARKKKKRCTTADTATTARLLTYCYSRGKGREL